MAVARIEPRCVTSTIFQTQNSFAAKLNDALNLSWTTFSTVGYGGISPATSAMFVEDMEHFRKSGSCAIMSFLLSFESLVGILFVTFAGAIMYVKLIQFQSNAQVKFSSVMVVKYGSGVEWQDIDLDDISTESESEDEDDPKAPKNIPCPVLIFRMANLLHSTINGEIVNAHVNTVATVDLKNAVMSNITRSNTVFKNALSIDVTKKISGGRVFYKKKRSKPKNLSSWTVSTYTDSTRSIRSGHSSGSDSTSTSTKNFSNRFGKFFNKNPSVRSSPQSRERTVISDISYRTKKSQRLKSSLMHFGVTQSEMGLTDDDVLVRGKSNDEGDNPDAMNQDVSIKPHCVIHQEAQVEMPNLVFAKIKMDPVRHPYFRTSWRVAHTLNQDSPLLSKALRKKIKDGGGYWPVEMNNHYDIRDHIDFDQFLVSFRGLSKATGNEVYAHQVYKKDDIKVGFQFKSILVQNPNGSIGVQPDDIDELKIQDGGF
jgi:hypothetical protein